MSKLKTKEDLLKDLTKANHARKAVLANRAGFNSVEDYRKHLQEVSIDNIVEASKPKIHIVNILDVSSSMDGGKFEKAFAGINNEIKEFQTDKATEYTASFVSFSYGGNKIVKHYFNTPITEVKTPSLYASGMTALNEAVGTTLEALLKLDNTNVKTIVSIFTDGGENASGGKYYSNEAVAEIIKKVEKFGITVTFIGTERDTNDVIRNFKIQKSNTLVHNNTAESIADSFKTKLGATMSYSANVSRGASQEELLVGFYQKSTGKL